MTWTAPPAGSAGKHPDIVAMGIGWTLLYVFTGIHEDLTSGGKGPAPK